MALAQQCKHRLGVDGTRSRQRGSPGRLECRRLGRPHLVPRMTRQPEQCETDDALDDGEAGQDEHRVILDPAHHLVAHRVMPRTTARQPAGASRVP